MILRCGRSIRQRSFFFFFENLALVSSRQMATGRATAVGGGAWVDFWEGGPGDEHGLLT